MQWYSGPNKKSASLPAFNASFNTANGIPEWIVGYPSNATGGPLIATLNGTLEASASGPSTDVPCFAIPTYNDQAVLAENMVSQYVKTEFLASVNIFGGGLRGGPAVALAGKNDGMASDFQGYYVEFAADVPTANLQSVADGGTALLSNIFVPADFDIIEIMVQFSAASNLIQVWQNGTQVVNLTHNAASRPVPGGAPGFYFSGSTASVIGALFFNQFLTRPAR